MRNRTGWMALTAGLALVVAGAAYAGGAECEHGKDKVVAAHDHGGHDKGAHGSHCALGKNVNKSAKMTDDGAVVTLEGKTPEAVKAIQEHLAAHKDGAEGCEDCPMGHKGVNVNVDLNDKGGRIVMTGSTPEAIKSVQEWAKKPAGSCCAGKETKS